MRGASGALFQKSALCWAECLFAAYLFIIGRPKEVAVKDGPGAGCLLQIPTDSEESIGKLESTRQR